MPAGITLAYIHARTSRGLNHRMREMPENQNALIRVYMYRSEARQSKLPAVYRYLRAV